MGAEQRPINYYDILSVARTATTEEVHAAYRARIAAYHPDRNPSTHAHAVAALINEAWEILGNPERRRHYDAATQSRKDTGPSESHAGQPEPSQKTVETCPRCGTVKAWVKRRSDGAVACWKCGHRQSASDNSTSNRQPESTSSAWRGGDERATNGKEGTDRSHPKRRLTRVFQYMAQRAGAQYPKWTWVITAGVLCIGILFVSLVASRRIQPTKPTAIVNTAPLTVSARAADMSSPTATSSPVQKPSTALPELPTEIPIVPAVAKKDAYAFADALVWGMSAYISAEDSIESTSQTGQPVTDIETDFINQLAALRTAQAEWRRAARLLIPFKSSQDILLAQLAGGLADSYDEMSALYGRKVATIEAMVRQPTTDADRMIAESKLQSQSDQVFNHIVMVSALASTSALIDLHRENAQGHAAYLKISRAEKIEIKKRLGTLVGPSPEDMKLDNSRSPSRVPALVLWRWLDKGWRGADE